MSRYRVPTFSRTVDLTRVVAVSVKAIGEELVTEEKEVTLFGHLTKEEAEKVIGCHLIKGEPLHERRLYEWNLEDIVLLGKVTKTEII